MAAVVEGYYATEFDHLAGDEQAAISTGERKIKTILSRLAKKHPEECVLIAENEDGSVYYHVPWSWLSIRPPKKMNLTDEQRQALRDRLEEAKRNRK